ncbi:MAG: Spy/CpxP family protein refolding chaperone [Desulfobacterales bacterium]
MMTTNANRNFIKFAILLIIGIFIVPGFAMANRQGPGKWEKGMGMKMGAIERNPFWIWKDSEMAEKFALTDEQIKKLKDADFEAKKNFIEMRSQMDSLSLEMEKAFAQDSVNDSEVLELGKKMSDIRSQMFMNRIESGLQLKKILTDEQFKKLGTDMLPMRRFDGCKNFGRFDGKMKRHWKNDRP